MKRLLTLGLFALILSCDKDDDCPCEFYDGNGISLRFDTCEWERYIEENLDDLTEKQLRAISEHDCGR